MISPQEYHYAVAALGLLMFIWLVLDDNEPPGPPGAQ